MSAEVISDGHPRNDMWATLATHLFNTNMAAEDIIKNLGIWQSFSSTARLLMFADLYRQRLVHVPGALAEFGVRWGQDLVWLSHLRGLLEPGTHRLMFGFDTFTGHTGWTEVDGVDEYVQDGAFTVTEGWESELLTLLNVHDRVTRRSVDSVDGERQVLLRGDVRDTVPAFLETYPHVTFALAVLDLDLYDPTRVVLEAITPRLHDGSVVVFDEFDSRRYPGETVAALEVFGRVRVRQSGLDERVAYVVIGE